jgi:hypothetical protein
VRYAISRVAFAAPLTLFCQMVRISQPRDDEIARLTDEVVRLKTELEGLRGRIGARQRLAQLREDNGSININKVKTRPPGYMLLYGPAVEPAIWWPFCLDLVLGVFRVGLRPDHVADIVHQDFDAAETDPGRLDGLSGAGIGLEIGDDRDCFRPRGSNLLTNFLYRIGAVGQREATALLGDPLRDGTADPLRRASHRGDFPANRAGWVIADILLRYGRCRRPGGCSRSSE